MSAQNKIVLEYIKAINSFDLESMSSIMHEEHTFIDTQGTVTCGKKCMLENWKAFFEMFPDYTITVEHVVNSGKMVAIFGNTIGSFSGFKGPHIADKIKVPTAWKAIIENESIILWQEYSDNTQMTRLLENDQK